VNEILRRDLLRWALGGLAAGPVLGASPLRALDRAAAVAARRPFAATEKMLLIFLRGAMDGVVAVVPGGDTSYQAARQATGSSAWFDPALTNPLTSFAGLNPALSPLFNGPWGANELALLHQVGNHDGRRSHFTEMQRLETADLRPPHDLNQEGLVPRLVQALPKTSALKGTSVSPLVQRLFQSSTNPQMHIRDVEAFRTKVFNTYLLQHLAGSPTAPVDAFVDAVGDIMVTAHAELQSAPPFVHDGTAFPYLPGDLWPLQPGDDTREARTFFRELEGAIYLLLNTECRVAGVELNQFDTHQDQTARLMPLLRVFGFGMASAWKAAQNHPTVSLTTLSMSEFGRTARVNGNNGTDHGLGGLMIACGPRVQGGVYNCDLTTWAPLNAQGALPTSAIDANACPVRTHYLAVLQEALDKLFGLTAPAAQAQILPGLATTINPPTAAQMTWLNWLL
jgi:uncharacterized protein (DUF1501 family)